MKKQLESIIKNQDIKGLNELIEKGLDISEIKLVEVFRTIYKSRDKEQRIDKFLENSLNTQFIEIFIEHGADIEYTDYTKSNIRIYTATTGNLLKIEKVLLSCLQFAFLFYDKVLIKYFVEQGTDINQELVSHRSVWLQSCPLSEAYRHNDVDTIRYLMDKGAKIDGKNLIEPERKYEANKLLLESGIHPGHFISHGGDTVVKTLSALFQDERAYDHFIQIDKNYLQNIIKEIKLFIEYGADVNTGCPINDILTSKYLNNDEVLDLFNIFLNSGLDVNGKDQKGNTPLLYISLPPHTTFEDDYNFDSEDIVLSTMEGRQLETYIIKNLIKNGALLNEKNNMGMTALMLASFNKKTNMVKLLLEYGADINIKNDVTAFDLADDKVKTMINDTRNHTPQKLVKILTNFTLDRPIKFTTHTWDFGDLKKEYKDFNGYMVEVRKQFKSFEAELKNLSPNLYSKIETFLLETNPKSEYSWCSKAPINIGWSSLVGLKEWCNDGKNPFDFPLSKPIFLDRRTKLTKFGEVIELFKQEIEIRRDFKNLTAVFERINDNLGNDFNLTTQKLERQFYTDVEKFTITLDKIFDGMKKHSDYKDIDVIANESEDGTIELSITQVGSPSTLSAEKLLAQVEGGDFADIKANLTNLCDWSVEGSFEESNFRINYLKSNNVKDIVELDTKLSGFTHILKFYKR